MKNDCGIHLQIVLYSLRSNNDSERMIPSSYGLVGRFCEGGRLGIGRERGRLTFWEEGEKVEERKR